MNLKIFEKIIEQETTKEAWGTLKKLYGRDEKLKKVKFLRKQSENLQMKGDETIAKFFLTTMALTNQMKTCGEKTFELQKVEKVLRILPDKFNPIMVEIKESILFKDEV